MPKGKASGKGLERYYPIFLRQHELNMKLQAKVASLQYDPSQATRIFKPILDGTVDPRDREKIIDNMVNFIKSLGEYRELAEFTKKHAVDFRDFYQELTRSSETEYEKFLNALEKKTIGAIVDALMKMIIGQLKSHGMDTQHLEDTAAQDDYGYVG
ncbi:MAG: hypothetical protein HY367_00765 [Candidatus Aenigmarchaeota archaeon]|nr:hypothetical protein [Candidatus Aenigmarchaeota archaeon]